MLEVINESKGRISSGKEAKIKHRNLDLAAMEGLRGELEALQFGVGIGKIPYIEAAPRFRILLEENPQWAELLGRYSTSPKHFVRLLVELYPDRFLSYSHLYKLASAINLGESSRKRNVCFGRDYTQDFVMPEPKKTIEIVDIMTDFEVSQRFLNFMKQPGVVLDELEGLSKDDPNPFARQSYERTLTHFKKIAAFKLPTFRPEFQPRPYQSEAILKGTHLNSDQRDSIGVFDEMRTGKTLIGLGRMEYMGIKKGLIVTPADVRRSWQQRIQEYFIDPPQTVVFEGGPRSKLLSLAARDRTRFVITSYDLLVDRSGWYGDEVTSELFDQLSELGFDGLALDEAQYAKNFDNRTKRARAVRELVLLPTLRQVILLTGTPVDRVRDMAMMAHLLDPEAYPTPGSFSSKFRDNPRLSHNELLPKMVRRTAKEVLKLPPHEETVIEVELTPVQKALYDYIHKDESQHQLKKLMNLRAVVLHPGLVRDLACPFDTDSARLQLNQAYITWKRFGAKGNNIPFDANFLVSNGFENLYIGAFCNLKGGIGELVGQTGDSIISRDWQGEPVPAKFVKIKEMVRECLERGEKIIVFSSFFAKGITSKLEEELNDRSFQTLLNFLKEEFGEEMILKIDGEDKTDASTILSTGEKVSERELIRRAWHDEYKHRILLTTVRSSSLGIDLSIQDPRVTGISEIFESLPFSHGVFRQAESRVLTDTQLSPVNTFILQARGTLDEEMYLLLQEKGKLIGMLLDAVELDEDEEQILDESPGKISSFFAKMVRSPRQNMTLMFGHMFGRSAEENRQFLAQNFIGTQTNEEYLANWYDEIYKNDGYSRYCAQVIKQVLEGLQQRAGISLENIADFGSGPLVMARTLGRPVYSLDLSQAMLDVGRRKLAEEEGIAIPGEYIRAGSLEAMPKDVFSDARFDAGICSLALDCTQKGAERLLAIQEMLRTIKPGGWLTLVFPSDELNNKTFRKFLIGFEKAGLQDELSLSGYIKGKRDETTIFGAWLFVLRKTGQSEGNIDSKDFTFAKEGELSTNQGKQERQIRKIIKARAKRSPDVDKYIVCVPADNKKSDLWPERGDLSELLGDSLLRHVLDLSDEELSDKGFRREKITSEGTEQIGLINI